MITTSIQFKKTLGDIHVGVPYFGDVYSQDKGFKCKGFTIRCKHIRSLHKKAYKVKV